MGAGKTARAQVLTCALLGVEAVPVTVEIEVGSGLPGMHIVGMADSSVQEARLRVKSACKATGYKMPQEYTVVNLAPASVRKSGSAFDLPIAVAYLVATGQIDPNFVAGRLIVGELGLDGTVRPVDGLIAYALCARDHDLKLLSGEVSSEMLDLPGLEHECLDTLGRLRTGAFLQPITASFDNDGTVPDFKDVVGQETAVRALTIAAAGGHGMMMVGPPGAGKSMLAKRLPGIMPPLEEQERVEAALIHSVCGYDLSGISQGIRPFRSPHHSSSTAALVGGGRHLKPGEVSLAHHGVLFLDELGEFCNPALQALRQPLEEGKVVLARAEGRAVFPARFQLLAASNPCPCGYLGDRDHTCKCGDVQVNRYQSKLGGPLKDRIDLICEVACVDPALVLESGNAKTSAELADVVLAARERALYRGDANQALSSSVPHEVIESCGMGSREKKIVEEMARAHHLSGRGIIRVIRVARTIADIGQSDAVREEDLYESFMYRVENTLE